MVNVLLLLLGVSIFTALHIFLGTANVMMRIPLYLALFLPYTAGSFGTDSGHQCSCTREHILLSSGAKTIIFFYSFATDYDTWY